MLSFAASIIRLELSIFKQGKKGIDKITFLA